MQMQRKMKRAWQRKAAVAALTVFTAASYSTGYAMPQGGEVKAGNAEIKTSGDTMNVNQSSQKAAIDWKGFDIAKQETVNFNQPNTSAIALNRVTGNKGSEIYGHLNANGQVFLINPNGVLFAKGAEVNVGGLVATTHNISNEDFMNSKGSYTFAGNSNSQVKNAGTIKAEGGLVALLASDTANEGVIQTKAGTTALAAGQSMTIDYENDGKINLTVNKAVADAKALNSGSIQANGGYVIMTARDASTTLNTVVNNTGVIEAKSLKNVNGTIVLDGGDQGVVRVGGSIDASGDEAGQTGGSIKVVGSHTVVNDGALLKASGDQAGGKIETSGDVLSVSSGATIDASSANGKAGEWLLDPLMVKIVDQTPLEKAKAVYDAEKKKYDAYVYLNVCKNNYTKATEADKAAAKAKLDEAESLAEAAGITNVADYAANGATAWNNAQIAYNNAVRAENKVDKTTGNGSTTYSNENGTDNLVSYVDANQISETLSKGTDVTIEARDKNAVASIEVDAAITMDSASAAAKSVANNDNEATLALKAERNVTVNKEIKAVNNSKLNVLLQSDLDGDSFGAVIVNANISTNGGSFTSASGTTAASGTVGTYFGHADGEDTTVNRTITTNGGAINLYGDVAVGLNGAALVLDTTEKSDVTKGGAVTITGNVDSGNSYKAYTDNAEDSTDWTNLVTAYYNKYLKASYNNVDYSELSKDQKTKISNMVARTWAAARAAAELENTTTDMKAAGVKYLATITTSLENSIANSTIGGAQNELLVGGHRSDGTGKLNDKDSSGDFYWVTGPEGQENNGTGVKFATADGTAVGDAYANWAAGEPNNSPNVAVGWTSASKWDDVCENNRTVHGFIQETNLNDSALSIKAGNGAVEVDKNIGASKALSNVDIQTTGSVNLKGSVTSDAAVELGNASARAASASVGGKITSGTDTHIYTTGSITSNGVDAGDNVVFSATDNDAVITLVRGTVKSTKAGDHGAVLIGTNGSFVNHAGADAIQTTGANSNWKVFSSSPYGDTFDSLNSNNHAKWNTAYTQANADAAADEAGNQYIFAYQPTAYVAAANGTKTYGDVASQVVYADAANKVSYWLEDLSGVAKNAFVTDTVDEVFTQKDGLTTSKGFAASARRDQGDYDENQNGVNDDAAYVIQLSDKDKAVSLGYQTQATNGILTVNRRLATVEANASQTYGNAALTTETNTINASNIVTSNGDRLGTVTSAIKANSAYTDNQQSRTTADAGQYAHSNAVAAAILDKNGQQDTVDYTIQTDGAVDVTPATITLTLTGTGTTTGTKTVSDDGSYTGGLTNGDTSTTTPNPLTYTVVTNTDGSYSILVTKTSDGTTVNQGDVIGNYKFNYSGVTNITSPVIERVKIDYRDTANTAGTGLYDLQQGQKPTPEVSQVLGLTDAQLPFFKVAGGQVTNYGTYEITESPKEVKLTPTAKHIPEPNKEKNQYRALNKTFTLTDGTGNFDLVYDGTRFNIYPVDESAKTLLKAGDPKHNVEVETKALFSSFTEMGIVLEDLDAVYVHMDAAKA